MTYNVDLMLEVREAIKAHPERHNQSYFSSDDDSLCGTTMCIAGWTAAMCGMTVNQAVTDYFERHPHTADPFPIDLWAEEKLGLSNAEANRLFYDFSNDRALRKLDEYIEKGKNQ